LWDSKHSVKEAGQSEHWVEARPEAVYPGKPKRLGQAVVLLQTLTLTRSAGASSKEGLNLVVRDECGSSLSHDGATIAHGRQNVASS
jgi:hypothetical protein